ncbi:MULTISPECIES: GNAT family N-acetyltransferase [Ruminococcus]|uniref:GNAT family N-acetyltransferase n=1 Tax=Ruminococcus bovis TaxID=2564099 RepID=A0A4V1G501_9FIRM|nr:MULTISPECIES: GNAT family N-acetyltransferase [Ruminococcus]MEE3439737.1 GNAT family N-acetyltransferase [Ruminococcus sp.]QCT06503.1 GNAT family N-acetyltransferase [Ruminococcus bovis]
MKIYEVKDKSEDLKSTLLNIWEQSVKATHTFLTDEEIKKIKGYVPMAISGVKHLIVAEDDIGEIVGFIGVESRKIEMLFISPLCRGKGIGKSLVKFGVENYNVNEVTVNQQNPQAVGFYEHLGFKTYKRTELDEEGNPYPLLYMKL